MMRFLLPLLLICCTLPLAAQFSGKCSAALQRALAEQPQQPQSVLILLKDRIEPKALETRYRQQQLPVPKRAAALINTLQQKAMTTQGAFVAQLENLPGIAPESIETFWITNLIYCEAQPDAIAELSRDARVEWMDIDWAVAVEDAVDSCPAPPVPNGREPGLDAIGAPFMWSLGYTGYGQKVLVVDSGNDTGHPAMQHNFAYNYLPMEQSWANGGEPYFCGDHGTHVGGTIVGLDRLTNDTIGVAFGALWQGSAAQFATCEGQARARNFVQIFEWAVDPDGNPATSDDRPDVINNSWSRDYPTNEDCSDPITRAIVDAVYATGIAVVFSASNEGPDESTIGNPPMENWDTLRMFSVGALNGNISSLTIADFSSRGPTVCGGEGVLMIKPEVSAPGVSVRSCSTNGTYDSKSGTSMAAPHVSGALLLLKEAFPYLEGEMLMRALYESSIDLGVPGEDNQYGRGMIYLPNAYQYLIDKGYEPVPPVSALNDVSLLRLTQTERSCRNEVVSQIIVQNNGVDTLYSLIASISLDGDTDTAQWELALPPSTTATLPLPILTAEAGEQELIVELLRANDEADARRLDNQLKQKVIVHDDEWVPAEWVLPMPVCAGGSASVRSLYAGQAESSWYDAATDGVLLGDGPTLILPGLPSDTTVFLETKPKASLGFLPDTDAMPDTDNTPGGLIFDVDHPFLLKSVLVYAPFPGGRVIRFDGENTGTTELVDIEEPGWQRIPLDIYIPAGKEQKLLLEIGLPLGFSESPEAYPYEVPNVVRVDSSTTGATDYRYFYDWEIEYDYYCGRTPVEIPVAEAELATPLSILASTAEVDLGVGNGEVSFMSNTADNEAWYWDFGDGTTSELANPTHIYSDTGTYRIQLTVQTGQGCTDAATFVVKVVDSSPPANTFELEEGERLRLFPNPTTEELWLQFSMSGSEEVQLRLVDMLGRPVWSMERFVNGYQPTLLDMRPYPAGAYWLLVQMEGRQVVRRVIKVE
jgi:subtilisin family serine protease